MRKYLYLIKQSQQLLLGISVVNLIILPTVLALYPGILNTDILFFAAHISLFLVMIIRPLADLLPKIILIRPLVILRKGMGSFSASIIVSLILSKLILDPLGYLANYFTLTWWSLENFALLAHLADISAILLLITSNNLSKRLLGPNWKRVQRLSYVYFYGSTSYVFLIFKDDIALFYMIVVTTLTVLAYLRNRERTQSEVKFSPSINNPTTS